MLLQQQPPGCHFFIFLFRFSLFSPVFSGCRFTADDFYRPSSFPSGRSHAIRPTQPVPFTPSAEDIEITANRTAKLNLITIEVSLELRDTVARLMNDQITAQTTIALWTEIDFERHLTTRYQAEHTPDMMAKHRRDIAVIFD